MSTTATPGLEDCRLATGWRHATRRGRCGWHQHPDLEIVYHPFGRGESACQAGPSFRFQADTAVVYPPQLSHDQTMHSDGEDWCVQIHLPEALRERLAAPWCLPSLDDELLRADLRHLTRPQRQGSPLQTAADHARAIALLASLLAHREQSERQAASTSNAHLERAQAFMARHFAENLSCQQIAEHCGLGPDRLRRIFVEELGHGPKQALLQMRIERCQDLLRHSNLSLRELATHCGFAHERHLSDCFRQQVGCAPGVWRREQAAVG